MESIDVSPYIKAKSDQLNSDDLIGGPITVQITAARAPGGEQPVVLQISGGHMPWKPCKTSLRVMSALFGTDAGKWVGRWVTLHRDPSVKWAGVEVGGIRVQAVSGIDKPMNLSLQISKGVKASHRIQPLKPPEQKTQGAPTADLDALLSDLELSRADVDRWRASKGKPLLDALSSEQVAQLAGVLAGSTKLVDEIRALLPDDDRDDWQDGGDSTP